jgi:TonB family protein
MNVNNQNMNNEGQRLFMSAIAALIVEFIFFLAIGFGHMPFFNDSKNNIDSSKFVDVQMIQLPAEAHLSGATAVKDDDEIVFNPKKKQLKKIVKNKPAPAAEVQNQVTKSSGADYGPTHGPIALYAPAPVIPEYLRNQNLNAGVVIEFFITGGGTATPKLLVSSGNEELDAIAVDTVKKWQFKPAENNNIPIDTKTRLRILFEVY